jgi:hypothetical protein
VLGKTTTARFLKLWLTEKEMCSFSAELSRSSAESRAALCLDDSFPVCYCMAVIAFVFTSSFTLKWLFLLKLLSRSAADNFEEKLQFWRLIRVDYACFGLRLAYG